MSRGQRAAAFVAVTLVGIGLSVSAFLTDRRRVTTRRLLYQSFGPLGVVLLAVLVLRRYLMRTALNRRTTVGLVVLTGAIATDRALALLAGVSPAHVLLYDCMVAAALGAAGSAYLSRWLALTAAIMLGAAVWAAASPDQAMSAFSAGAGLGLIVLVAFTALADRRV